METAETNMADGMGCKCAARYEGECCCSGVDWVPTVYYHDNDTAMLERELKGMTLKAKVARLWNELRAVKKQMHADGLRTADLRDAVSDFLCTGQDDDLNHLRTLFGA